LQKKITFSYYILKFLLKNNTLLKNRQGLAKQGHKDAAFVHKRLMANPQVIGKKLKKVLLAKDDAGVKKMAVPKALSMILDRDLTKGTYNEFKREATICGANIYPNYNLILAEKKRCRPTGIQGNDTKITAPLQETCVVTVTRLFQDQDIHRKAIELAKQNGGKIELVFYFKYGLDGSSGFTKYKQLCSTLDKGSLLASHMQIAAKVNGKHVVLWNNSLCNSPYACRPLCYWMIAETLGN
jgi:hypothetical protein